MELIRRSIAWVRDHPRAADLGLAILLTAVAIGVAFTAEIEPGNRELGGLGWSLLVLFNMSIALRRTHPVPTLWLTISFMLPYWILDYPDDPTGTNLLIALYSLAAHEGRPRSIRHFWMAIGVVCGVLLAGVLSTQDDVPWVALPANIIITATAWILGDNLRTRRQYMAELEEKASRTEERQAAEARRAVNEERTRIARELHDVVAHSMSVIVVQAGAARRVIDTQPAQAADAMAAIEATGRESLTEMRRVLGVLRSDNEDADLVPAPDLDDLERLLHQCDDAGLPVELVVDGEARRLPAGLEMNVFRVVQESLTNTLKHAGQAHAEVHLAYRPHHVEVAVRDNGNGAASIPAAEGSGQGIIGMRERVEAYGGELEAGPQSGGGYQVRATFMIEETQ